MTDSSDQNSHNLKQLNSHFADGALEDLESLGLKFPVVSSIGEWETEIYCVMDGVRDGFLIKLGSVERYFLILQRLAGSEHYNEFHIALEHVVRRWDVTYEREIEYFSIFLELIGKYTPVGGYRKVLAFLDHWRGGMARLKNKSGYHFNSSLRLTAVGSLLAYFKYPPETGASEIEIASYSTFKSLILEFLNEPELAPDVIVACLLAGTLQLRDQRTISVLRSCPRVANNLVSYVFKKSRRTALESNLRELIVSVMEAGGEAIDCFLQQLSMFDCSASVRNGSLVCQTPDGRLINVELTESGLHNFRVRESNVHRLPEYFEEIANRPGQFDRNRKIGDVITKCERGGGELLKECRRILCTINFDDQYVEERNSQYRHTFVYRNIKVYVIGTLESLIYLQNLEQADFETNFASSEDH